MPKPTTTTAERTVMAREHAETLRRITDRFNAGQMSYGTWVVHTQTLWARIESDDLKNRVLLALTSR